MRVRLRWRLFLTCRRATPQSPYRVRSWNADGIGARHRATETLAQVLVIGVHWTRLQEASARRWRVLAVLEHVLGRILIAVIFEFVVYMRQGRPMHFSEP